MERIIATVLLVIQLASMATVLYFSWLLLDWEVFGLVAASLTLFTSLYVEHRLDRGQWVEGQWVDSKEPD